MKNIIVFESQHMYSTGSEDFFPMFINTLLFQTIMNSAIHLNC